MMKKLGLFILLMVLIISFAVPVLAYVGDDGKGNRFYLGGVYMLDAAAWNRSKELMGTTSTVSGTVGGGSATSDNTQFLMQVPVHSRLVGFIEAGNAGAFFDIGMGTGRLLSTSTPGAPNTGQSALGAAAGNAVGSYFTGVNEQPDIDPRQIYGYYKFGNCELRAGKMDGWLSTWVSAQRIGADIGHVYSFGWGHFYDGRFAQARFMQTVNKQFGWQVSLVAPNQITAATAYPRNPASYAQYPIISAKLSLDFGVVALYPGGAWGQVKWDGLASGWDDSMTMYYLILPVKVTAGPFLGWFELGYGQNVANLLVSGNAAPFAKYGRLSNGQVTNTTQWNGIVDLGFTAGPVTPHLYFGFDQQTNSNYWTAGDDHNLRWHAGISANYAVTPNFSIWPEFSYYNWGNNPGVAGAPSLGTEWLLGLEFVFSF